MKTKAINILENRINAVNELHKYNNEKIDQIIDELNKGFTILKTYKFDKETNLKIKEILKTDNKKIRSWIEINEYSIILNMDINYQTSEFSCEYYKIYCYIGENKREKFGDFGKYSVIENIDFEKRTDFTLTEIEDISGKLSILNDEMTLIKNKIDDIKSEYPFF